MRFFGRRYRVLRPDSAGASTEHRYWGTDMTDASGYFDRAADVRPGDVVVISERRGSRRTIETVTDGVLDGNRCVTWRRPGGAPGAFTTGDLHPRVREAAGPLYAGGHYAEAIGAATKTLDQAVRARTGLTSTGSALMGAAFADDGPIDLRRHPGVTGQDEQRGFRFLFMGSVAGLRNPRAHEVVVDDAVSALEHLAFVSLLFRRLDAAATRPASAAGTPTP